MASIGGFDIPETIVSAFKEHVQDLDSDAILYFAKIHPRFKSFRKIKKNVEQIRKIVLKEMIAEGKELPPELLGFLAGNSINQDLIRKLPLESLELFLVDFSQLYGVEQYLKCLLLDDREEVRQVAIDAIEQLEGIEGIDEEEESNEEHEELTEEVKEKLSALKAELKQAKKSCAEVKKKNKRLSEKVNKLKAELDQKSAQVVHEKKAVQTAREQLAASQDVFEQLQFSLKTQISEGVDQSLQAIVGSWLEKPLEVESLVDECDTDDLLGKVQKAITKQADNDKHFGNVTILRERLVTLEEAEEKIEYARRNALQPIRELKVLSEDVENEIEKIRKKLEEPAGQHKFYDKIFARINEASTTEKMESIAALVNELNEVQIISDRDSHTLRKKVKEVMCRLNDEQKFGDLVGRAEFFPCEAKGAQDATRLYIIIDGHNVILAPDSVYLFDEGGENGLSEKQKREWLTSINEEVFGLKPMYTVKIFFDSPTYSVNNITPNITEVYSGGGQEDQRADNAIIDYLVNNTDVKENEKIVLVTNDMELRSRAGRKNVDCLSIFEYSCWLKKQR